MKKISFLALLVIVFTSQVQAARVKVVGDKGEKKGQKVDKKANAAVKAATSKKHGIAIPRPFSKANNTIAGLGR